MSFGCALEIRLVMCLFVSFNEGPVLGSKLVNLANL